MAQQATALSPSRGSSSRWFDSSWLDQALTVFTKVEPGEGAGALLLALNVFLLLAAYYLLKTVRESFILTEGGAEVKAYASAGQAALLLFVVPAYSWLANRLTRFRLLATVNLFFLANLLIFFVLSETGFIVGIAFYLWLGIFNVMTVAQFWAFANDLYTEDQGRRLFPLIGVGSSIGALVGAKFASVSFAVLGAQNLLLGASIILLASLGITAMVNRRACSVCAVQRSNAKQSLGPPNGFSMVLSDRYLRLIAIMVVLLNVVNTSGEFLLSKLVLAEAAKVSAGALNAKAAQQAFIGHFYGNYFAWVGLGGLVLQLFLVSRLFRWVGVRGALFLLPTIALGGYAMLAAIPMLTIAFAAKIGENATDYSVENTARQALFLPVSREAKYKAKTAIDTFFYRAGDVTQAGIIWIGTQMAFSPRHFAAINLIFVAAALAVVSAISRIKEPPETPIQES